MQRFLFLVCFCIGAMFVSQPAHAGKLLEFFFPSLRDAGPDPSQTLKAPFAEDDVVAANEGGGAAHSEASMVPLHLPHRSEEIISTWVVTAVSDSLNFNGQNYQDDIKKSFVHFDDGGRSEFEAFLKDNKIMDVLQSSQYSVQSYVSAPPLLLNEGAVNKRYRWLYQVPVTVSYLKKGTTSYKGVEATNQHFLLQVQVGRNEEAKGDLGTFVERWSGRSVKKP